VGSRRSMSRLKMGMRLSRKCSFNLAVTWIFRGRMDARRYLLQSTMIILTSRNHTLANFSSINLVSISLGIPVPRTTSNPVYSRYVDSSSLGFSLSSYRQSYIGLVCNSQVLD
jgi:hypothetical protein